MGEVDTPLLRMLWSAMCKSLCLSIYFFILFVCPVFGQKASPTPQTEKIESSTLISKRTNQIERLNNALLSERIRLSRDERVSLFASLAKIWKDANLVVAKTFLKKAVDQATPLLTDDPKEKTQKIERLRKLISLSSQIDPRITERIIDQLESESEAQPTQRLQNSIALTEASLAVIATNPKLGFDMALAGLGYLEHPSQNEKIRSVILFLAMKDKSLSERLLLRVLQFAQNTSDFQSIGDLALFASPKSTTVEIDFLSDSSKKYLLTVFLENLIRLSALFQQKRLPAEQKEQTCILFLIGKGLSETINAYLPEKSSLISQLSQQSNLCQRAASSSQKQSVFDELSADTKDLTIEELIQAGRDATDATKMAFYFTRAVGALSREKKFERALELLDDMDERSRKAMGTSNDYSYWRAVREASALDAVLQKLEAKDLGAANRIIEKTPTDLRPTLQIQVSREILSKVSKVDFSNPEQSFAFALLTDARQKLPDMDDPFSSVNLYISLVRRYAVLLPDEVTLVFREMVKAINRADDAKAEKEYQGKDFANGEDVIALPGSLLENEDIVLNHIEAVQRPYSRVRLKLGLLNASVTKSLEEKKLEEKSRHKSHQTASVQ